MNRFFSFTVQGRVWTRLLVFTFLLRCLLFDAHAGSAVEMLHRLSGARDCGDRVAWKLTGLSGAVAGMAVHPLKWSWHLATFPFRKNFNRKLFQDSEAYAKLWFDDPEFRQSHPPRAIEEKAAILEEHRRRYGSKEDSVVSLIKSWNLVKAAKARKLVDQFHSRVMTPEDSANLVEDLWWLNHTDPTAFWEVAKHGRDESRNRWLRERALMEVERHGFDSVLQSIGHLQTEAALSRWRQRMAKTKSLFWTSAFNGLAVWAAQLNPANFPIPFLPELKKLQRVFKVMELKPLPDELIFKIRDTGLDSAWPEIIRHWGVRPTERAHLYGFLAAWTWRVGALQFLYFMELTTQEEIERKEEEARQRREESLAMGELLVESIKESLPKVDVEQFEKQFTAKYDNLYVAFKNVRKLSMEETQKQLYDVFQKDLRRAFDHNNKAELAGLKNAWAKFVTETLHAPELIPSYENPSKVQVESDLKELFESDIKQGRLFQPLRPTSQPGGG